MQAIGRGGARAGKSRTARRVQTRCDCSEIGEEQACPGGGWKTRGEGSRNLRPHMSCSANRQQPVTGSRQRIPRCNPAARRVQTTHQPLTASHHLAGPSLRLGSSWRLAFIGCYFCGIEPRTSSYCKVITTSPSSHEQRPQNWPFGYAAPMSVVKTKALCFTISASHGPRHGRKQPVRTIVAGATF